MQEYAAQGSSRPWYSRIALEDLRAYLPPDRQVTIDVMVRRAHARDNLGALNRLTMEVDGRHQFIDKPPLMVRVVDPAAREVVAEILRGYRATLTPERQQLLDRYTFVDLARKVVGVGSVGTQCWVAYFHGADENDPLFLQVKEAQASVLEPYLGRAFERHHGHRVVNGQRNMQASSRRVPGLGHGAGRRQLLLAPAVGREALRRRRDHADAALLAHARACGWALARAHARSGSPIAIAAYMGTNGRFERSMTAFAEAYADQNDRDHDALVTAVRDGRLQAIEGV